MNNDILTGIDYHFFDMVILALVLILGIKGFISGFIKELFGLIGIIGGVFLGSRYADEVAPMVQELLALNDPDLTRVTGFFVVFIAFWLVIMTLSNTISKMLQMSNLGFFNSLLGFFMAGGKYFLILAIIFTTVADQKFFKDKLETKFAKSEVYPVLIEVGSYIMDRKIVANNIPTQKEVSEAVQKITPTTTP